MVGFDNPTGLVGKHFRGVTREVPLGAGHQGRLPKVNALLNQKTLVILVEFSDQSSIGTNASNWANKIFPDTNNSVADYYNEISYGQFSIVPASESQGKLFLCLIILIVSINLLASNRFSISIMVNYLIPADKNFKDIYGSGQIYPGVKLNLKIYKEFYLWGGFGFLAAKGETASQLMEEAKWKQLFLSLGGGCRPGIYLRIG